MKIMIRILQLLIIIFCINTAHSKTSLPRIFLFIGSDPASSHQQQLDNSQISGAQIIYSWKQLEPQKGKYRFTKINDDLTFLSRIHKKLFIQIQDRSFEPTTYHVPDYIREDASYHGGVAKQYDFPGEGKPITSGWVARVWDPAVRERFQLLIEHLAAQFDGKIDGINLPETAVDFDANHLPEGFTNDNYFNAELENIALVKKMFSHSLVIQYVNFFPGEWNNDHHYMSRLFAYALQHQIGLGGPDAIPYRLAHMKNSYPFFHHYKGKLLAGIAIQEPDYTYKDPASGNYYTFADFYAFAKNYLGASILFWNVQEPFYSEQLLPKLTAEYFED